MAAICAAIALDLITTFFVELAKVHGIYDNPSKRLEGVMSWIAPITEASWYPWVAGMAIGFTIGIWLVSSRYLMWREQKEIAEKAISEKNRIIHEWKFSKERLDASKKIRLSLSSMINNALGAKNSHEYIDSLQENECGIELAIINDKELKVIFNKLPPKLLKLWEESIKFRSGGMEKSAFVYGEALKAVNVDRIRIEQICDQIISECSGHQ
ncbi:hypothetical protein [Niveispirillum sp.]|uniref:hypothetical protein n=1 Tax=Niveispirillum sp. TaxID=1917217 RepID=UPI001B4F3817|nr:hypothetical protein [Niveispirillum sp.]MBP7334385.1 hypothetical protein [Niveispirillum sp.]